MDPQQARELYDKYFYQILATGIVIGLLLCTVPLILAIRRQKRNLGIFVFVMGGIVGAFSPILSLILALLFSLIFWKLPAPASDPDSAEAVRKN